MRSLLRICRRGVGVGFCHPRLLGKTAIVLGSTDGVTNFQRGNFLQSFLSAGNEKALNRQEVFRNNPALQRGLLEAQQTTGIKFDSADRQGRITLWEAVANRIVTPELKARYQGTLSNGFDNFKSKLFNDEIGLLSFSRELKPGNIDTSVVGALTKLFQAGNKIDGKGLQTFADSLLSFGIDGINGLT